MSFTPKFVDLVKNSTSVQGTANVVLGAAPSGFSGFVEACSAGDQFYYCIQSSDKPAEREVGKGTLLADGTIGREALAGAALTKFSAGAKTISLVAAADWFAKVEAASGGAGIASVADRAAMAAEVQPAGSVRFLGEGARKGLFRFEAGDQSALVAADPCQGMTVAPMSDPTGASGAWRRQTDGRVSVEWFGAKGDDTTDDSAAFVAAIATLRSTAINSMGYGTASGTLFVPAGSYFLGTTTIEICHTLIIEGEATRNFGGIASLLRWSDGTTGIRVNAHNTLGTGLRTPDGTTGGGTIIRQIGLKGGFAGGAESESHGIHLRCKADIDNVWISDFGGDGIHIRASAGSGGATEGNVNCFHFKDVSALTCRNGLWIEGADANAGLIENLNVPYNRQWGYYEASFLGNTYVGGHSDGNGFKVGSLPASITAYDGHRYAVRKGQETGASTNAPSGTTADNAWWYYLNDGEASLECPGWSSGMAVRPGGAYYVAGMSAQNVVVGQYTESGQAPAQVDGGRIVGGMQAAGIRGAPAFDRFYQGFWRVGNSNGPGAMFDGDTIFNQKPGGGGTQFMAAPGSECGVSLQTGNFTNAIEFRGSDGSLDGYFSSSSSQYMYFNHKNAVFFRAGGADIFDAEPAGLNLAPGKELRVANSRVLAGRKGGWTPASGLATRTAFDTATVTTEQLAERVKALIDDLHSASGHGLIGA